MILEKRYDLYTGEEFIPKRKSQKFATAENRIAYHNEKAAMIRKEKSIIDKPLHINYRILTELLSGLNEATFHQEYLRGKGFDFSVYNHTELYDSKYRHCVYQYILIHENPNTKIVRNDRYPKSDNC